MRNPAESPPLDSCAHCSGEIYPGDEVRRTADRDTVHDDCAWEYALERTFSEHGVIDEYNRIY